MYIPNDTRLTNKKLDFQLPGNLADDSVILDTVQLPVKNHLFLVQILDVSSNDLYHTGNVYVDLVVFTRNAGNS